MKLTKMSFFKLLVYISLLFVVYTLYRKNYFVIPAVHSYYTLFLSVLCLWAGFVMNAVSWRCVVSTTVPSAKFSDALASVGLSVFGKYIPGKIWMIVGRASYMGNTYSVSISRLSALSLTTQVLIMWLGLMCGTAGLFLYQNIRVYAWVILPLWFLLSLYIFSPLFHSLGEKIIYFITRRRVHIPRLDLHTLLNVLPWCLLYWFFYSTGFYLLMKSITSDHVPIAAGLGFPLAGTLGVMAVIAPGGLGVREGVMGTYLVLAGFSPQFAVSVSIVARMWYFSGEVFVFVAGLISSRMRHTPTLPSAP